MEGLEFQNCQKIGDEKLHVVSCYAPTTAARREDKTKFYNALSFVVRDHQLVKCTYYRQTLIYVLGQENIATTNGVM